MKKDKIQLTDNAKRELEMFRNEQAQQLIDIIVRDKSYPGLDKLEVTAGDIMKYGKRIKTKKARK